MFLNNKRGYTLVELIIVMAIFLVVIMITATAFKSIVTGSSQQSKSVETQIEGIVGLDILRSDLEQAGFGLPWTFLTPVVYTEAPANTASPASFWSAGRSPGTFNDAPGNPPRAVASGTTTFNQDGAGVGSTYLVIKSTIADASDTSKKWTTVSYDAGGVRSIRTWGAADRDFTPTEHVTVVKNSLMTTPPSRQLMATSSTAFSTTFSNYSTMLTNNHQNGDTFQVYGVNANTDLGMPFNRADYYVMRPAKMPQKCAANTGILYKSIVLQTNGTLSPGLPLLDCIADMQVVYGLDTSGAGVVNSHTAAQLTSAEDIRNQVKEIRVYLLAQEGTRDTSYRYPSQTVDVGESFDGGTTVAGRRFDLLARIGADYKYYRWKVYTIVVRPKNLIQ